MFEYESASMDPRSSSFHRNEYTIQLQFWLTIALLNFIIVNTHVSCRPSTTFHSICASSSPHAVLLASTAKIGGYLSTPE